MSHSVYSPSMLADGSQTNSSNVTSVHVSIIPNGVGITPEQQTQQHYPHRRIISPISPIYDSDGSIGGREGGVRSRSKKGSSQEQHRRSKSINSSPGRKRISKYCNYAEHSTSHNNKKVGVHTVVVRDNSTLITLDGAYMLQKCETLDVSNCKNLKTFYGMVTLPRLRCLLAENCGIESFAGLSVQPNLEIFSMEGNPLCTGPLKRSFRIMAIMCVGESVKILNHRVVSDAERYTSRKYGSSLSLIGTCLSLGWLGLDQVLFPPGAKPGTKNWRRPKDAYLQEMIDMYLLPEYENNVVDKYSAESDIKVMEGSLYPAIGELEVEDGVDGMTSATGVKGDTIDADNSASKLGLRNHLHLDGDISFQSLPQMRGGNASYSTNPLLLNRPSWDYTLTWDRRETDIVYDELDDPSINTQGTNNTSNDKSRLEYSNNGLAHIKGEISQRERNVPIHRRSQHDIKMDTAVGSDEPHSVISTRCSSPMRDALLKRRDIYSYTSSNKIRKKNCEEPSFDFFANLSAIQSSPRGTTNGPPTTTKYQSSYDYQMNEDAAHSLKTARTFLTMYKRAGNTAMVLSTEYGDNLKRMAMESEYDHEEEQMKLAMNTDALIKKRWQGHFQDPPKAVNQTIKEVAFSDGGSFSPSRRGSQQEGDVITPKQTIASLIARDRSGHRPRHYHYPRKDNTILKESTILSPIKKKNFQPKTKIELLREELYTYGGHPSDTQDIQSSESFSPSGGTQQQLQMHE